MSETEQPLLHLGSRAEIGRRRALQLLSAAVAAAKAGCIEPPGDEVLPYVRLPAGAQPEGRRMYATSMLEDGLAIGLLVESQRGRPTKIEGNPIHPASLGATSAQQQASVLDLYDPSRARTPTESGLPATWSRLVQRRSAVERGELWIVVPPTSSPSLLRLLERIRARRPSTRVVYHANGPDDEGAYRGAELAFAERAHLQTNLSRAKIIACLDADAAGTGPNALRRAREICEKRAPDYAEPQNRLYAVEPMLTCTGTLADWRLPLRAGAVTAFAVVLGHHLHELGHDPLSWLSPLVAAARARLPREAEAFASALARDLHRHPGQSALLVGQRQPAACHALVSLLNHALNNFGRTLGMTEPPLRDSREDGSLAHLAQALRRQEVGALIILDANIVHAAPPALELGRLLRTLDASFYCGIYRDETAEACRFHAPISHYLETWSDARAYDGTLSIIQPLIRPLYDTRSPARALSLLSGLGDLRELQTVRESVQAATAEPCLEEKTWKRAVSHGLVAGSAFAWKPAPSPNPEPTRQALAAVLSGAPEAAIELNLAPSPAVLDGRFANNVWLQELPHPVTKQTWGNALLLPTALAQALEIEQDGQLVRVSRGEQSLVLPSIVVPEHAPGCATVHLGYGAEAEGLVFAREVGANGYRLRDGLDDWIQPIRLEALGKTVQLARTQRHFEPHERDIVHVVAPGATPAGAEVLEPHERPPTSFQADNVMDGPQWAMTIDTTLCSGCSACVIACQAENNTPVVGEKGVLVGREMHWLRVDLYRVPHEGRSVVVQQPMLCQHCELAPCEYVCPVFATTHSPDGLNEMTYNRCIGTRFCSNNCPYKVRRFNFFDYNADPDQRALQHNPEVTVRARGVMEKCTYCVQRIRREEIEARMQDRAIRPGEVVTACQQACPTRAIQFGDLSHRETPMVKWRHHPRSYAALHGLGTWPRTLYLARLSRSDVDKEGSHG